jgi:hypothetical protein
MPQQDTAHLKERILTIIKTIGPSLPSHISSQIGSSPVYFLPGQENDLERYSPYLKSREKDAFLLLKERKFLKDSEQEPAIRVALRSIKDFAIPFQVSNELYWRFLTADENEFQVKKPKTEKEKIKERTPEIKHPQISPKKILEEAERIKEELPHQEKEERHEKTKKILEIKKKREVKERKAPQKKTPVKKKISTKKNDNFFNKVKEVLSKNNIEILDIESFNKNDLILRIKENGEEKFLFAYNKKKISEQEILKSHKKASESGLRYKIFSLGEPPKKTLALIEAIKSLSEIKKITED